MKTFFTIVEWVVGIIGIAMVGVTIISLMFLDSPSRIASFTRYQNIITSIPVIVLFIVLGVFIISIIGNFVTKDFPWSHIVGGAGLLGIVYAVLFFTSGIFS